MPTLYVLRHGQTDWNAAGRLQGATDIPINETGRAQARRNGRALAAHISDPAALAFASSPLVRATETLDIALAEMGVEAEPLRDARLMEARFGTWEGRLMTDISVEEPDAWETARKDRWRVTPPGAPGTAENFETLAARVEDFLEETFLAGDADMLVATHGGVMRVVSVIFGHGDADDVGALPTPQDRVMAVRPGGTVDWI